MMTTFNIYNRGAIVGILLLAIAVLAGNNQTIALLAIGSLITVLIQRVTTGIKNVIIERRRIKEGL